MACPICGANCQCRNRGPGGLCCSCHRHKPSAVRVADYASRGREYTPELLAAVEKHREWLMAAENVKTWGEVMSKRKDMRNGRESGSWKPHRWRSERAGRTRSHALDVAFNELSLDLGAYRAALVIAEVRGSVDAAISRAAFEAAHTPVIGA